MTKKQKKKTNPKEQIKQYSSVEQRLEASEKVIEALKKDKKILVVDLRNLKERNEMLEIEIDRINEERQKYMARNNELREEIGHKEALIVTQRKKIKRLTKEKNEIENAWTIAFSTAITSLLVLIVTIAF